jgi:hypothetical protein
MMLSGGASPSPSICWLVRPRGIVLLSRMPARGGASRFPKLVDLLSVRAADDWIASVTTSDGRVFSTTDGQAWQRSPPSSETVFQRRSTIIATVDRAVEIPN